MPRLASSTLLQVMLPLLLLGCVSHAVAGEPNTVLIGAEDDAAPWSYADGSGYANSIVVEAFKEAGWHAELKVVPYARCKRLAEVGELAGCFSVSRTATPEPQLIFPKTPVIEPHFVAYATPDSPMNGCDPKTWSRKPHVGLVNGYEYVDTIENLRNAGAMNVQIVNSEVSGLNMIAANRIDTLILTLDEIKREDMLFEQASAKTHESRGALRRVCDFGGMPAYIAFSAKHPQGATALAAYESGIAILKKNGRIKTLQREWAERALLLERTKATRSAAERPSSSASPK
jgi:polar amino acid transport system substrate-binding protein